MAFSLKVTCVTHCIPVDTIPKQEHDADFLNPAGQQSKDNIF